MSEPTKSKPEKPVRYLLGQEELKKLQDTLWRARSDIWQMIRVAEYNLTGRDPNFPSDEPEPGPPAIPKMVHRAGLEESKIVFSEVEKAVRDLGALARGPGAHYCEGDAPDTFCPEFSRNWNGAIHRGLQMAAMNGTPTKFDKPTYCPWCGGILARRPGQTTAEQPLVAKPEPDPEPVPQTSDAQEYLLCNCGDDCNWHEQNPAQPCWGQVDLIDYLEDGTAIHACKGHARMMDLMSVVGTGESLYTPKPDQPAAEAVKARTEVSWSEKPTVEQNPSGNGCCCPGTEQQPCWGPVEPIGVWNGVELHACRGHAGFRAWVLNPAGKFSCYVARSEHENLREVTSMLTSGARAWLRDTCKRFAEGEGYEENLTAAEECARRGLILRLPGGVIRIPDDTMHFVCSCGGLDGHSAS